MKMYLSSYHLGENSKRLANLFGENKNVAIIMNAMDFVSIEDREVSTQREISDLQSLGLNPSEIDLRDFFNHPHNLAESLKSYGGVWVRGGNVFLLRKAMRYSGFDQFIIVKNSDQQYVFSGFSAGICILGPSLKGLNLVDYVDTTPAEYQPDIIWEGLNLLPYTIIPHYKSNHPESERIENVVQYFKDNHLSYKTLSDGEVIVLN